MNEAITQPAVKPKRQLTEAQKAALKKGRDALAAKRCAILQNKSNEHVQTDGLTIEQYHDNIFLENAQDTCISILIVLSSYFIMFIICQQL
jgi:hypothetical protein